MELELLQKKIIEFRDARNWKQFHNPKDVAISLVLESSELLEHFQWKNKEEVNEHVITEKEEISHELADILYLVLLMSNDLDINIWEALIKKLWINNSKYPVEKSKDKHTKYTKL